MSTRYAHPEAIVETEWLARHLDDPGLRVVEVNGNVSEYLRGHIPGAVGWEREQDLEHPVRADVPSQEQFSALMSRSGIAEDSAVVLYGDGLNRHATWAFFVMKLFGHKDVRLLNGGKKKWEKEGRPLTRKRTSVTPTRYQVQGTDPSVRATREEVLRVIGKPSVALLDVRTREEFEGRDHPEHPQTGIRRLGHIPGAAHRPWEEALKEDGSFKSLEDLEQLYRSLGITRDKEVITYCRLGVRASHSWFVLKYVLGNSEVRVYDGSWNEWGNLVGAPIEK
ncbi:MAG: sulfurtransferase [Chloroflexi bacterium]|nr:sulfurtransferase [Chloroflexota bacterium]